MSEYCHLLIPTDSHFVPSPDQVSEYLQGIINSGVVGDSPTIRFVAYKRVTPKITEFRNPFTGEPVIIRGLPRKPEENLVVNSVREFPPMAIDCHDYSIDVYNHTIPKLPPLVIDFGEEYHLSVSCQRRSQLVSTSDLHSETTSTRQAVRFDDDCDESNHMGLYTHPQTLELLEVPGAGCALFWIQFQLGKSLFPKIEDGNLQILNPRLVDLAKNCFGTQFTQGCVWGS
jgi:hypothetical protein